MFSTGALVNGCMFVASSGLTGHVACVVKDIFSFNPMFM